jgi:tetratricopeptide (TPR) repeat protein
MTMNLRSNFGRLANNLIMEGKKDKAIKALDRCFEVLPENNVPYTFFVIQLADAYYKAGENAKGDKVMTKYAADLEAELKYYFDQKPHVYKDYESEVQRNMQIFKYLLDTLRRNQRADMVAKVETSFRALENRFLGASGETLSQGN